MAKLKNPPKVPAVLKGKKDLGTLQRKRAQELDADEPNPRKVQYRAEYANIADPTALVKKMAEVQAQKEALEERLKNANAAYDVIRLEMVPALFENEGVENITVEGVGRCQLTGDLYVSVKSGEKDALFAWLKKNKLGALIQPAVSSSTLRASIKERLLKEKSIPRELLNVTPYTRASITKKGVTEPKK